MYIPSWLKSVGAAVLAGAVLAGAIDVATPVAAATTITRVASSSSGSSSSRTSITLARPAGTAAGHVMVASIVTNDDAPAFTAPAGWSLVRNDQTSGVRQGIYLKIAGSSEPSSYTWALSDWRRIAGGITTYAEVDTANPVDAQAAATNPSNSTTVAAPAVTTTVPGTMLVHFAAVKAQGSLSPPATMTERWEAASPNLSNDRDALASSADSLLAGAGPTGPRAATVTPAGPSIGALVALRPAGPPPPPDTDPPETAIASGPSGTVNSSVATFTFSADEAATFACSLDGATPTGCSSPKTYTGLGNGTHTFTVTATDTAGNSDTTPASRTWTVDVPPVEGNVIETVAGTGTRGFSGDGGPATAARLAAPRTMATDPDGNIFFVDTENNRVRRIDATSGVITTVAGTGTAGYSGDGGSATAARLNNPHGIDVDDAGNIYVADPPNQRIRRVDATTGVITTVAGTGTNGYNGDNIPATSARLNYPKGVTVAPDGSLYIGDADNNRVRRVSPSGTITTVAGTGTAGYSGDGGPATAARLHRPRNVDFDGAGNLYIADQDNVVVRRMSPSGTITTIAGSGIAGFAGDGGPATAAKLRLIRDVAVDAAGNIYIADEQNNRIRVVTPDGIINTFAGTGVAGFSGDGGPPAAARLSAPRGVAVDPQGRILIADTQNHRIRRVRPA